MARSQSHGVREVWMFRGNVAEKSITNAVGFQAEYCNEPRNMGLSSRYVEMAKLVGDRGWWLEVESVAVITSIRRPRAAISS